MLRARIDSSSSSPDKIFTGVRFVLFGFDSVSEAQYRSELVSRGGTDVGRYDSICTHVIVCGRVYDDPVCVATRHDGKTLVTELWIDDSLSLGMLADATRVLYRPVKDLNGIPGSESLYICLTGYQRQERDDIMKMVSLMGARFSKPLIANQVTHLICYKFEGEKYELAKKVNIKLVNHRWLEDCLTAWEILPIASYAKSSWELEILEAEARDSEEETEDPGTNTIGNQILAGASSLQGAMPDVSIPTLEKSNVQQDTVALKRTHSSEDRFKNQRFFSTPCKESISRKDIDMYDLNNKVPEEFGHKDVGSIALAVDNCVMADAGSDGNLSIPCKDNLKREGNTSSSYTRIPKKGSPLSNAVDKKLSDLSYSRKTPRKLVSVDEPANISPISPQGNLFENMFKTDLREATMKQESACIQSPTTSVRVHHSEANRALPQKRKNSISSVGANSPKSDFQDSKVCAPQSPLSEACRAFPQKRKNSVSSVGAMPPKSDFQDSKVCAPQSSSLEASTALPQKRKNSVSSVGAKSPKSEFQDSKVCAPQSPSSEASRALPPKRKNSISSVGAKSPKLVFQDSKVCAPQSPLSTTRSVASPQDIIDNGLTDINTCLEGASTSDSKVSEQAAPSKFKSLSYKKRSLKRGKPTSGTKNSPSVKKKAELRFDGCPRQALVEPMNIENKSTTLETRTTGIDVSHRNCNVLPDLPLGDEPRQAADAQASIRNSTSILGTFAIDDRCTDEASPEEKMPKKSLGGSRKSELGTKSDIGGDIAMHDMHDVTTKEPGETSRLQQDEGVLSPDGRDSETRKLSSTTAADTCKENGARAASRAFKKKGVAKRSFGSKKPSTGNLRKDKTVACSDKTFTQNNVAVKLGKVGEAKAEQKHDKETNEAVKPVSKGVIIEDKVKVAEHSTSDGDGKSIAMDWMDTSMDSEKENKPKENRSAAMSTTSHKNRKVVRKHGKKLTQSCKSIGADNKNEMKTGTCATAARSEPAWFILSGHRLQRKEFQMVIRRLRGRLCRDSHNWSYQATHFIVPDPVRRTEKFFAAAAAGRWILKTDYLTASNEAGKFLDEEPFEWHLNRLSEDGAISLEAPRKWRLLRERTSHGAFYGMRIIIYGDCIAPTLDTLKRVVKAGDGAILATSPPYTRFLESGVDYAVVSPSMPRVDSWVQEFMRHEIPCVSADYLVEYVCKPGYSLERHVLFKTHGWAEKSFANLLSRSEEAVAADAATTSGDGCDDIGCSVCGSGDRGEVMLICGDEGGAVGCGVGTHIDCCDPPLDAVPEGDWLCPKCSGSRDTMIHSKRKSSSKV